MKAFFHGLEAVYGPKHSDCSPIPLQDGDSLITDRKGVLNRCAEHLNSVLNRSSKMNEATLDAVPQLPVEFELDAEPSIEDLKTQSSSCLAARLQAQTSFLPKYSSSLTVMHFSGSSNYSKQSGAVKRCPRTSRMRLLCTYTSARATAPVLTITGAFPGCPLRVKSLLASY